ncbi:hypothetical protein [Gulosibacter bifidus]|uniref:Uncharacterized protein n=1 Tax=Gulosibacter bifidus TaxID=272239 RepID=A0ABW5RK42_9MICO|nr:hypothetical protein [Gulosibacter bifidus]
MMLLPVVQAAEIVEITPGHMWFPPVVFGVITLVIFIALLAVTFSFRNMSESHPVNPTVAKYEPVGHPGHPIVESDGNSSAGSIEAGH